ncbi:hypothetical protein Hdeb2414_s0007g00239761 [Helianthus debilis subsp. tardiflorus]
MGHLHWFTRAVPSPLQSIYNARCRSTMVERLTEEHRRPFRPSCLIDAYPVFDLLSACSVNTRPCRRPFDSDSGSNGYPDRGLLLPAAI